jgi:valyl-tRNA synthetase
MGLVIELIRGIRNVRSEYNVEPNRRIAGLIAAGDHTRLISAQADLLQRLARLDPTQSLIAADVTPPAQAATVVVRGITCFLPLAGLVDVEAERARLRKELNEVLAMATRSERQLSGPFAERAPTDVVQRERDKLTELRARSEQLQERLYALE